MTAAWSQRRLAALALCALPAAAPAADALSTRWLAQTAVIAATGTRDLDDRSVGAAYVRPKADLSAGPLSGRLEGWLSTPGFGMPSTLYATQAWVAVAVGPAQVLLGRQVVNWGRTDRLNPTDNLSPRSLRALTPQAADDRLGADMVTLDFALGAGWRLTAHEVPQLRADDLPRQLTGGMQVTPAWPAGRRGSTGVKLDHSGTGLDASLSLFDGLATRPVVTANATGLAWSRVRRQVLGADASWAASEHVTVRAEFADSRIHSASRKLADDAGVAASRWTVVGAERALDGGWLVSAALSVQRNDTTGVESPQPESLRLINRNLWVQSSPRVQTVVLALTKSPFEDDWSGELSMAFERSSARRAGLLQALVQHRIDDVQSWRLLLQVFRGSEYTSLGSLRRNSLLLLEWRAAFGR